MIEIWKEGDEYVAWAPDALLTAFGETPEEARANLVACAQCDYEYLCNLRDANRLSRHLAATIPAIAQILAVEPH